MEEGGAEGDAQTKQTCHGGGGFTGFVREARLALLATWLFFFVFFPGWFRTDQRSRCALMGVRSHPAVSLWTEGKGVRALAAWLQGFIETCMPEWGGKRALSIKLHLR